MQICNEAAQTYERLGSPEGELALAQAVLYLAVAPKSNAGYMAYNKARAFVKQDGTRPVPMHLRNAPTKLMKELDYGKGYRYAHDEEGGFAAGESYLLRARAARAGDQDRAEARRAARAQFRRCAPACAGLSGLGRTARPP
jgi:replication-associated recombination protein RarA